MDIIDPQGFHPNNRHSGKYPFERLGNLDPDLCPHLKKKADGKPIIDFSDPVAVKALNRAILKTEYSIQFWDFPNEFLCPAVPGRVDYIHYLSDLLENPKKANILDIGTGASAIYAVLVASMLGWSVKGTDINPRAIESANHISHQNPELSNKLGFMQQKNDNKILEGVVLENETFDATICNPPFYESEEQANKANQSKIQQHQKRGIFYSESGKTFAGVHTELFCEGGEKQFIRNLIEESVLFSKNIKWFTTLVSQKSTLKSLLPILETKSPRFVKIIPMQHGNKRSRILAWSFQN